MRKAFAYLCHLYFKRAFEAIDDNVTFAYFSVADFVILFSGTSYYKLCHFSKMPVHSLLTVPNYVLFNFHINVFGVEVT
jgi:hypothetical protein